MNTDRVWTALRFNNERLYDVLDEELAPLTDTEQVDFAIQILNEALERNVSDHELLEILNWISNLEYNLAMYIEWLDVIARKASARHFKLALRNFILVNDNFHANLSTILMDAYWVNDTRLRNVVRWLADIYDKEDIVQHYVQALGYNPLSKIDKTILEIVLSTYDVKIDVDEVQNEYLQDWLEHNENV